jgi:hypothetical protein
VQRRSDASSRRGSIVPAAAAGVAFEEGSDLLVSVLCQTAGAWSPLGRDALADAHGRQQAGGSLFSSYIFIRSLEK